MSKKFIAAVAAVLLIAAAFCAAFYFYISRYDAGDYVKAVLDVSYKNKTASYVEITGVSEEEAFGIFEESLDATMEGFESTKMPEEIKPMYRELFAEVAKKVSYNVKEPVKKGRGSYEVTVTVKPVSLFPDTYDDFREKSEEYAAQITDSVTQGGKMPTDEEMQKQIYEIYYEVLREKVDSGMLYGEPQEVILHVNREGIRGFSIDPEDMDLLDSVLIEDIDDETI